MVPSRSLSLIGVHSSLQRYGINERLQCCAGTGLTAQLQAMRRIWVLVAVHSFLTQSGQSTNTTTQSSGAGLATTGSGSSSGNNGGGTIDDGCNDDGVASYTRFSSDNQDFSSNEQQDAEIAAGALTRGLRVNPKLKFTDEAVSGTKLHREGLDQLMEAARKGQIKVLFVYSLSRLARECLIALMLLKELVYMHNVRVVSVSEGIDSTQVAWELMATILSVIHEQFIKTLSAQVKRGQEYNIEKGYSAGDWCYGYDSEIVPGLENDARTKNGKPRKRVIINYEQAKIVLQIFNWYVNELRSIRWIARKLTELGIKKEHGGRTRAWHHDSVKRILSNLKYIGQWRWGRFQNKRVPMTGQIFKVLRDFEEVKKWTKQRPHLRIVDEVLFFQAQDRLAKQARRFDKKRRANGKFTGSTNDHTQPRHLLQGIIKCGHCGGTFKTYGGEGRRLHCTGYEQGLCTVKTTLVRDVVERMLLDYIRQRMLANHDWLCTFMEDVKQSCNTLRHFNARPVDDIERELHVMQRKIDRLLDSMEEEAPDPSIKQRLSERNSEKEALERQLILAKAQQVIVPIEPTEDWIREKLVSFSSVLAAEPARAGVALQNLLGPITVSVINVPGSKLKRFEGKFTLDNTRIAQAALSVDGSVGMSQPEEVTIRFTEPPEWAAFADQIYELWDEGKTAYAISEKLQCHYSWVDKGLAWWHQERGLPAPTYLEKRQKFDKPSRAEAIADDVGRMINEEVPLKDIARILKCHKDTVTAAKKIWFERNNLPVPDGRTLRRERNPNSRRRKAS